MPSIAISLSSRRRPALLLAGAGDTTLLALWILLSGLGSRALVAYQRNDTAAEATMKFLYARRSESRRPL